MKKYLIIIAVSILAGGIMDHLLFLPQPGKIDVKEPIVSKTQYIKPKSDDCELNKKRAESPIQITGNYKDGNLGVDAFDSWKSAHAEFPITCTPIIRHHIWGLGYLTDKRILPNYHYALSDIFAVGGGTAIPLNENLKNTVFLFDVQYRH